MQPLSQPLLNSGFPNTILGWPLFPPFIPTPPTTVRSRTKKKTHTHTHTHTHTIRGGRANKDHHTHTTRQKREKRKKDPPPNTVIPLNFLPPPFPLPYDYWLGNVAAAGNRRRSTTGTCTPAEAPLRPRPAARSGVPFFAPPPPCPPPPQFPASHTPPHLTSPHTLLPNTTKKQKKKQTENKKQSKQKNNPLFH